MVCQGNFFKKGVFYLNYGTGAFQKRKYNNLAIIYWPQALKIKQLKCGILDMIQINKNSKL
jgi:hypothetical protein